MKNKFYSMVLGAALLLCAACGGTNSEKAQSNGAAANGKAPNGKTYTTAHAWKFNSLLHEWKEAHPYGG